MGFRRWLAATATAMALLVVAASPADATVHIDRWDLTAAGSAHTVLNNNQLVVHRCDVNGYCQYVFDSYFPWYGTVGTILPGNAAGTPLRIRLVPPLGYGLAFLPNGLSAYNGWATGTGYSEGQNYWADWCVTETVFLIPLRDPQRLDSYGTELAVC